MTCSNKTCNQNLNEYNIINNVKKKVVMNVRRPQANYPPSNFSNAYSFKFQQIQGSIGHVFAICFHTENQNQKSFFHIGIMF